ncbi:DUF262 domain-containing protein [Bradyrhizobium lablabi]|uniref:DUF262 domain-containing protein n=1 Tax=Bradyrhizobium lablabi TaxID=722472 RepID=UPI001BAAE7EE|nr:DUF262 domain-containing protein [Bradyrhizobium lablabi]MBR0692558.1 DUF262 domain-containing protein [Bradyrhizobium lablabi]
MYSRFLGFQRPYTWTSEQARDLFYNLWDAARAQESDEDVFPCFLGDIVLIKPEGQVVDGQQRLATIALLLAGIRANLSAGKGGNGIR